MTKEELDMLFEECREEIRQGKACDSVAETAKEKGWLDPVALALSTDIPHYLAGKTMEILSLEIDEELKKIGFAKERRKELVESLYGYALIQHKEDLSLGRYIRWISERNNPYECYIERKMTNGAFLVDIREKVMEKDTEKDMEKENKIRIGKTSKMGKKEEKEEKEVKKWNLLCKNWKTQFILFEFRPGMVFQQLNREEIMVMLLSSNL